MADTLITRLSNLKHVVVRPTSSVRRYLDRDSDPLIAGKEQQVDAVLEGSLQRAGDRIRLTVRLLSVRDGAQLWAYKCDEDRTDIFAVQDAISEKVASALAPELTGDERARLTERYTNSTEALQAYQLGRYFWNKRTEEGMKKGITYFEQAKEKDPNFALAYVGLADSYNMLGFYAHLAPQDSFPKAKAAALEALRLKPQLAEGYNSLAFANLYYDWDWAAAEQNFRRAIALNPNYAVAHQWYGSYFTMMGRWKEAIAELERAEALDPLSLTVYAISASTYYQAREYNLALKSGQKTLEMDPNFALGHVTLGQIYIRKEMHTEAVAEFQQAVTLTKGAPYMIALLAHAYALSGKKDEARRLLGELDSLAKRRYVSSYHRALIYLTLGQKEQTFKWLNQAIDDRQNIMIFIEHDPRLDELRSDVRFQELLRRVGLTRARY